MCYKHTYLEPSEPDWNGREGAEYLSINQTSIVEGVTALGRLFGTAPGTSPSAMWARLPRCSLLILWLATFSSNILNSEHDLQANNTKTYTCIRSYTFALFSVCDVPIYSLDHTIYKNITIIHNKRISCIHMYDFVHSRSSSSSSSSPSSVYMHTIISSSSSSSSSSISSREAIRVHSPYGLGIHECVFADTMSFYSAAGIMPFSFLNDTAFVRSNACSFINGTAFVRSNACALQASAHCRPEGVSPSTVGKCKPYSYHSATVSGSGAAAVMDPVAPYRLNWPSDSTTANTVGRPSYALNRALDSRSVYFYKEFSLSGKAPITTGGVIYPFLPMTCRRPGWTGSKDGAVAESLLSSLGVCA